MSNYDLAYDVFTNRYSYLLFVSIKQFDTHVYFDLYDYVETEKAHEVEKRLIKKDIILPKEIFLYFRLCGLINSRTIEKKQ